MRNPEKVLNSLGEHAGQSSYRYERLYRILYNPQMYLMAYGKIASKEGNMTEGTDGKTIDGMSIARIDAIISSIKSEKYQPNPSRRTYIPKRNGKLRPLGIPSIDDKLVQEVCRTILESIYEGYFESTSHGFRPNKSCHTALGMIRGRFNGCKWFVEGDIEGFFDNIDHETMINILRIRIKDERFLRLIRKFLNAGYMEEWTYHKTYSGTPQGGIISPILANIYLDQLDKYMNKLKKEFDRGTKRATNPEYRQFGNNRTSILNKMSKTTDEDEIHKYKLQLKENAANALKVKASLDIDDSFRRIQYVRYADDFLIGVIGSKQDAKNIKNQIKIFLSEQLKLTLSKEKTLITNGHKRARFLGYDVYIRKSKYTTRQKTGKVQRQYANKVVLKVPTNLIKAKLMKYEAMKISVHNGKEIWIPQARVYMKNQSDLIILERYNSEIRGIRNYYRLANNCSWLHHFKYIMEYSMYKTLACKYRTTKKHIIKKHRVGKDFGIPYITSTGETKYRLFYNEGFTRIPKVVGPHVDNLAVTSRVIAKTHLISRLESRCCEWCNAENVALEMHHVRKLKELDDSIPWAKLMKKKRRKSLALCNECHTKLHENRLR